MVMPSSVVFEGQEVNSQPLSPQEQALLTDQLLNVMAAGSAILHDIYASNLDRILAAAAVAKLQVGASFTGLSASDSELGMQHIRPGHIMRTTATTETPNNSWSFAQTSGTAQAFIGYSTSNGTAINIDKRAVIVPLAVGFSAGVQPVTEELYVQLGSTTYPVMVVRNAWLADNLNQVRIARLRPMIWPGRSQVLVQANNIAAQTQEMPFLGVTFGKGDFLRLTSYASVQL